MQRSLHRLYDTVRKKYYRVHPEYWKNNYFRETKAYKTNLQKLNAASIDQQQNWQSILKDNGPRRRLKGKGTRCQTRLPKFHS